MTEIQVNLIRDSKEILDGIHQARTADQGRIARHFCATMSSTYKKVAVVAIPVLFVVGSALLTAAAHGGLALGAIALIGFSGLTISSIGLYIGAIVLLAASIYLCLRLMCAPDNGYIAFLDELAIKTNILNQETFNFACCAKDKNPKNPNLLLLATQSYLRKREEFVSFLNENAPKYVQHDSLKRVLNFVAQKTDMTLEIGSAYNKIRKTPYVAQKDVPKVQSKKANFLDYMLRAFV